MVNISSIKQTIKAPVGNTDVSHSIWMLYGHLAARNGKDGNYMNSSEILSVGRITMQSVSSVSLPILGESVSAQRVEK